MLHPLKELVPARMSEVVTRAADDSTQPFSGTRVQARRLTSTVKHLVLFARLLRERPRAGDSLLVNCVPAKQATRWPTSCKCTQTSARKSPKIYAGDIVASRRLEGCFERATRSARLTEAGDPRITRLSGVPSYRSRSNQSTSADHGKSSATSLERLVHWKIPRFAFLSTPRLARRSFPVWASCTSRSSPIACCVNSQIDANVGKPQVSYQETITVKTAIAEGTLRQDCHWRVRASLPSSSLSCRPAERGSRASRFSRTIHRQAQIPKEFVTFDRGRAASKSVESRNARRDIRLSDVAVRLRRTARSTRRRIV